MPKKLDPKVARAVMKKAGFSPMATYPGSNSPWKSKCLKCKKITTPTYWNVRKGIGCKFCSNRAVEPRDAEFAMNDRGFRTLEPYPGAVKPWLVQCMSCKKVFKSVFHSLKTDARCKYCSKVAVDEKDLLERLTELNLKPLEKYKSAKTPWKCRCLVCNHVVQPTWMRLKQGRGQCAFCSQRRVDVPSAKKFMKSLGLKPLVDFPGSNKPWDCVCLICGLEASPRWSDVRGGQGGCSNCADYGLNYKKPGYIYLITHEKYKAHKIGIANSYKSKKYDDRMYHHEKQGWSLFKKMNFESVQQASDLETSVLKWLRLQVGLPIYLSPDQMPKGGHTETVNSRQIDPEAIWAKIEELSRVKR
jgi:hypothetical protein